MNKIKTTQRHPRVCPVCAERFTPESSEQRFDTPSCEEVYNELLNLFSDKLMKFVLKTFSGRDSDPNFQDSILLVPCDDRQTKFLIIEPNTSSGDDSVMTIAHLSEGQGVWEEPTSAVPCKLVEALRKYRIMRHNVIRDDSYNESFQIDNIE